MSHEPIGTTVSSEDVERHVVAVYEAHSADLLRYARSLARDDEAARDSVQEVFLRYFMERRCGREIEQPRAWLYQSLRNHVFNRFKSAAVQLESADGNLESMPDPRAHPEKQLQETDMAREMAAALTTREMDCLLLRAQGFEYSEIGEIMGIRPGTVGAVLSRVSRKLRSASFALPPRQQDRVGAAVKAG